MVAKNRNIVHKKNIITQVYLLAGVLLVIAKNRNIVHNESSLN